jgi:hypothetical protein
VTDPRKFAWTDPTDIVWLNPPQEITVVFHYGCDTPHRSAAEVRHCPHWEQRNGRGRWVQLSDVVSVTYTLKES